MYVQKFRTLCSAPQCGKTRNYLTEKKFRQINHLVISLVKPLLSRNFCEKVWERISAISSVHGWVINYQIGSKMFMELQTERVLNFQNFYTLNSGKFIASPGVIVQFFITRQYANLTRRHIYIVTCFCTDNI